MQVLEHVGARIVGDRLGMGSLYYSLEIPENGDPIKALAEGYLKYPFCSTIHKDTSSRAEDLIEQAHHTHAHGVVLLGMKFCEPEFFDYPDLKERLEKAGIPVLVLETELGMSAIGPVRTRIEAFLETLRANMEERG
jgi:benzoyl-CoA reductase/2-hydroxyglutaryl-CoA dehydratase subunit BcrC/BadD/HgdB